MRWIHSGAAPSPPESPEPECAPWRCDRPEPGSAAGAEAGPSSRWKACTSPPAPPVETKNVRLSPGHVATPKTGRSIAGCQGVIWPVAASRTTRPLRPPTSRKSPPTTRYRPSDVTLRSWTAPLLLPGGGVPVWPWKYPPLFGGGTKPSRRAPVVASRAATWGRSAVPIASKSPPT